MSEPAPQHGLGPVIREGDWAGWSKWSGQEPFEDHCLVRPENMNGVGSVHGGALLTFADYSLFLIAYQQLQGHYSVTVSLNGEFLTGAPVGARLISRGEVLKTGRSLLFVRGVVRHQSTAVFAFSGVLKILRSRGGDPLLQAGERQT
jgi:uncharacterized protein (TIGR00369 family)